MCLPISSDSTVFDLTESHLPLTQTHTHPPHPRIHAHIHTHTHTHVYMHTHTHTQGMVEPGESVSKTLKKEFGEEAMNSLEATGVEKKEIEAQIAELFRNGKSVSA